MIFTYLFSCLRALTMDVEPRVRRLASARVGGRTCASSHLRSMLGQPTLYECENKIYL